MGAPQTAYTSSALSDAREESELLAAERERLESELSFVQSERFTKWSGDAHTYLYVTGRDLKRQLGKSANERDVLVEDKNISWDKPAAVDAIREVLFGLELIDEIQLRLFRAHDAVRTQDEDALGLVAIQSLKLESQRGRRPLSRGGRRDGVDLADLLRQQRVNMQFEADEATIAAFLELCREPGRTLVLDRWQVLRPQRPGEPCAVKGTLAGIAFKQPVEEEGEL